MDRRWKYVFIRLSRWFTGCWCSNAQYCLENGWSDELREFVMRAVQPLQRHRFGALLINVIDLDTTCQGDTFVPAKHCSCCNYTVYNNIHYWPEGKKVVRLVTHTEPFLENIAFSFSAHFWLMFFVVIHYVRVKYSLDCPVVTLDLRTSQAGLNKSHMQIIMGGLRPFISHLREKEEGRMFPTQKEDFNKAKSWVVD